MASYILARLRRVGSGLFVSNSPGSTVTDSSLPPGNEDVTRSPAPQEHLVISSPSQDEAMDRSMSPRKEAVSRAPSPQEAIANTPSCKEKAIAKSPSREEEAVARSLSPQEESEDLFVSQEEAVAKSPSPPQEAITRTSSAHEQAVGSPSPVPATSGLTQAEFEDSQRASKVRLPWVWRVNGKTTEEYTPQIKGKWWSKTPEELSSVHPNKRRDYGHIGRIMETELGEQLFDKQSKYHGLEMRVLGAGTLREREDVVLQKDDRTRDVAHRPIRCPVFTGNCGQAKLDGLVSLLKANSQGTPSTEAIEASASSISANTLPSTSIGGTDNATPGPSPQSPSKYGHRCENFAECLVPPPPPPHQGNPGTQNRSAPITPASSSSSSFAYPLPRDVEPTPDEAELWFYTFQTKYMEHVPFAIPYIQNTSSTQLRQDKPVLWLGIMAVACPFVRKQLSLGRAFKELIAREVVVNGDRSTDLLLAILTFGHWAYYFLQLGPILTTLTHLSASILVDLELDKPCQNEFNKHPGKQMLPKWSAKFSIPEARTMEHRRLAMAAYSFSASCAFFHHKTESVPWSTYHEETLKILDEGRETRADAFQVTQVKFMHILNNINRLYTRLRCCENESTTQMIVPYIRALKCQLNNLKNQMPDYVAENKGVQLSNFYVEIAIYETALVRVQYVPLAADRELETMQCLLACTQALRSWKDLFLTLGPTDYVGVPITLWKQLGLVIHTVMRLATLEDPSWDVEQVKQTVNLPAMFDVICSHLDYVANLEPWKSNVDDDDIHRRSRKHMIGLMNWTNAVFTGLPTQPPSVENPWPGLKPDRQQQETRQQERRVQQQQQHQQQQQQQQQMQTAHQPDSSHMLMMNGQNQSSAAATAAATAAVLAQQMQPPLPPEMFPYFNQEPWAEDVFGFWDLYAGGKIYGST
ncbi:hypothetical protein TCE0_038f12563 [Talaromyces pinophilus]|uniref:Uncharacterized protein n=1 Tax=Talaromyces pinophilus TaxID=128442 RepID=A0A0B8MYI2_TALPI|nr:hypothetical protein TCE0_038f12563 [Talaromyces pinophilus]